MPTPAIRKGEREKGIKDNKNQKGDMKNLVLRKYKRMCTMQEMERGCSSRVLKGCGQECQDDPCNGRIELPLYYMHHTTGRASTLALLTTPCHTTKEG